MQRAARKNSSGNPGLNIFVFPAKRKDLALLSYLFYVRVNPLYTLRRNPAESVTVDFFIADPNLALLCLSVPCSGSTHRDASPLNPYL